MHSDDPPIRVGVSACLLGRQVRYDGGHRRDDDLIETLGPLFEWVEVCPEVEMGLGTPRPTLRLVGEPAAPRLVFTETGVDQTPAIERWSRRRLDELERLELHGYILKSRSPSCGMERVPVYRDVEMPSSSAPSASMPSTSQPSRTGVGLWARALMDRFPLLPVEEEGRLHDLAIRENFVARVLGYHRWTVMLAGGGNRDALAAFHTRHQLLLMAHSPARLRELGRLVADSLRYGELFMAALAMKATPRKHVRVLRHISGFLERYLEADDRAELLRVIADYERGLVPLAVPLTLVRRHLDRHPVPGLADQVYLNPRPRERRLQNQA